MKLLWGQIILEMRLFVREKASMFWSFLFPVFIILLFGAIFGGADNDAPMKFRVGIADRDQSPASRNLVENAFTRVPVFRIVEGDLDSLLADLEGGTGTLVIEIPQGFETSLAAGSARLPTFFNRSHVQFNSAALAILENIEYTIAQNAGGMRSPLVFEPSGVGTTTHGIDYVVYLMAGVIGMSVMSTCLFGIGFVLTSYRDKGNLKRLQVTPLSKSTYILGLILQRYFIILVQTVVVVLIAVWVFDIQLKGSLLDSFAFLSLGILTFITLGFMIGARIRKSETGAGIANAIFFPMMFLSETFFPVDGLPNLLQPLLLIFPLRYLNEGLRIIIAEGQSLAAVGADAAILAGFGLVFFFISLKTFRWQ